MPTCFCPAILHVLKVTFLSVCPVLFVSPPEIEVLQAFAFLHETLAAFSSQYLEKSRYHVSCQQTGWELEKIQGHISSLHSFPAHYKLLVSISKGL